MIQKADGKSGANVSIFVGDLPGNNFLRRPNPMSKPAEERRGLFGTSPETDARVEAKREETKKKVSKVVMDQFDRDMERTDAIKDSHEKIEEMKGIIKEMNGEIRKLYDAQEIMRKELGISEDSEEYQDAQLLVRAGKGKSLSKEEWERVYQLTSGPLTAYQERCLADERMRGTYEASIEEAIEGIREANSNIYNTKQATLKQHGMADALVVKADIEKAGMDEIIGMLCNEAMEHIKEELEKEVEAAKEKAEEKAEQEEKAEEKKAEEAEAEARRAEQAAGKEAEAAGTEEEIKDTVTQVTAGEERAEEIQAELKKILAEAELLTEDQKGLLIDQQL